MNIEKYNEWSAEIESGNYGDFMGIEANPYFAKQQEVENSLNAVVEIAIKNNMSLAELTKTLVTVAYRKGITPA